MRKTKAMGWVIDDEVYQAIRKEAKKDGRSVRAYIDYYFAKKFGIDLTKDNIEDSK